MKLRSSKAKLLLVCIVLSGALLVLKAVSFFTAKPKITVNYIAEYNRITQPAGYDPNDNAAPFYQKAFDTFIEMPRELRIPYLNWPTDYNSTEQTLLEEWLASNSHAFEYFRIAADKPYYWLERKAKKDNFVADIMLPDLAAFRELTKAFIWDAKLNAVKGQSQAAFENILDCYRAGNHKCRPNLLLMEQHVGLGIKQAAVQNALIILDKSKVEDKALEFLQNALQSELNNDDYMPDIRAEKLFLYDALQRTFIDNGKGAGRLAWSVGFYYDTLCGAWPNLKRRLNCFIGPRRNEIMEQIKQVLDISAELMPKTPWQVKSRGIDYFEKIKAINNSNFFLRVLGISPKSTFHLYHKTKTQTEALITTLAVLRFKNDKNRFPSKLDELVSTGYLQSVPMDPYSDGPLVCKLIEDDFKLYSVGIDFSDNGGVVKVNHMSMSVWPGTISHAQSSDIVYWPVQQLEKPEHRKRIRPIEKQAGHFEKRLKRLEEHLNK
jgi:hypothetical protein